MNNNNNKRHFIRFLKKKRFPNNCTKLENRILFLNEIKTKYAKNNQKVPRMDNV